MKKSIKRSVKYIILLFLFSNCSGLFNFGFDLYELAHFRKDGSGKFEIIFSLDRISKLMFLGEYMAQDHIEFARLLIQDAFLSTGEAIGKIPGITKVANIHDDSMLHFKLTFEFKNTAALNKAMDQINLNAAPANIAYFDINDRVFIRTQAHTIPKLIDYYQGYDDSLTKSFDLPFFFRNMRYIVRYSFSQEIRKATNPLATIAKDRKSLIIIQHVFDKKEKDLLVTNRVFFKKDTPINKPVASQPTVDTEKNINEARKLQSNKIKDR